MSDEPKLAAYRKRFEGSIAIERGSVPAAMGGWIVVRKPLTPSIEKADTSLVSYNFV